MSKKNKYFIKFILSTMLIPVPQFFVEKITPENNLFGLYGKYILYPRYCIYFALILFLIALYFLLRYILEEYKEIKKWYTPTIYRKEGDKDTLIK